MIRATRWRRLHCRWRGRGKGLRWRLQGQKQGRRKRGLPGRGRSVPRGPKAPGVQMPAAAPGVGTVQIASLVNLATLEALRTRRDKAAAKERLVKLPDHGRQVAPQELNKLPAGFPTRSTGGPIPGAPARGDRARSAPVPGAASHEPPAPRLPAVSPHRPEQRAIAQVGTAAKPSLTGVVHVELGVLLDIALLAGMDLAAVLALTGLQRDPKAGKREEATLAALEHCAPRALAQQAGAMMGLSPIARRAQPVTAPVAPHRGAEVAEKAPGAVATDRVLEAGSLGERSGGAPTTGPSRPHMQGLQRSSAGVQRWGARCPS